MKKQSNAASVVAQRPKPLLKSNSESTFFEKTGRASDIKPSPKQRGSSKNRPSLQRKVASIFY